jgi:hypothetical protein
MGIGERLHSLEVTERIKRLFPQWEHGLTPGASVRRTLNYNSDRHREAAEATFRALAPEGFYERLR